MKRVFGALLVFALGAIIESAVTFAGIKAFVVDTLHDKGSPVDYGRNVAFVYATDIGYVADSKTVMADERQFIYTGSKPQYIVDSELFRCREIREILTDLVWVDLQYCDREDSDTDYSELPWNGFPSSQVPPRGLKVNAQDERFLNDGIPEYAKGGQPGPHTEIYINEVDGEYMMEHITYAGITVDWYAQLTPGVCYYHQQYSFSIKVIEDENGITATFEPCTTH